MRARCSLALTAAPLAVALACSEPRAEQGVDVFSADTLPVRFTVSMTGDLAVSLRFGSVAMRPDRSLILETPGSLVIRKGAGTATVTSLDSTRRLALQPLGTPPDSVDVVGVVGSKVRMTRDGRQHVTLEVLAR